MPAGIFSVATVLVHGRFVIRGASPAPSRSRFANGWSRRLNSSTPVDLDRNQISDLAASCEHRPAHAREV